MALCECGCGQETRLAPCTAASKHWVKGVPLRFIRGHDKRSKKPPYTIEDRGYKTPCWIWQRCRIKNGYGIAYRPGAKDNGRVLAHRAYYEDKYGPIPEGKETDHLCRIRLCINPDHVH